MDYFKHFFGDWERDIKLDRKIAPVVLWLRLIRPYYQLRRGEKNLQGRTLVNDDSGKSFTISSYTIDKMLSGANRFLQSVPALLKRAVNSTVRPDSGRDATAKLIHEMIAPLRIADNLYWVRFLGKEFLTKKTSCTATELTVRK